MEGILRSDWLPEHILPPRDFPHRSRKKKFSLSPAVFLRDRTAYDQKYSHVCRLKQWTGLSRRVEMEQTSEAFWTIWHKTSLTW